MKLHLSMGRGSCGIRNEDGDIVGGVHWHAKDKYFVVLAEGIPEINRIQADNVGELRTAIEQALGTAPTIEVFTAPLVIELR